MYLARPIRTAISILALGAVLAACSAPEETAYEPQSDAPVLNSEAPPPSPPPPPPPPPTDREPSPTSPWSNDEPGRAPGSLGLGSGSSDTTIPGFPPQQGGVALPADYEIVSNVLSPTQSYLPGADNMPTGVVLLDARASDRNEALCLALLGERTATVRTETAARTDDPDGDYLVTHWLTRSAVADEGDCNELLAKYDFERATRIKQTYALSNSRGPVFLALDPTGAIMFLDLEDATSNQVFQATADWMSLALKAPQTGPNAGKPPEARGIAASANRLFASIAGGFASLVGSEEPTLVRFNDPVTGTAREFRIYRAGIYLIGATFVL